VYHAIVRAKVRALWQRISSGDYEAAVGLAAPDVHFRFVGPPPVGADLRGREAFATWFGRLSELIPGMRMSVRDVWVGGWPWRTRVTVHLGIEATLADGTAYTNEAVQCVRLRWGRMVEDFVFEDTARLADAVRVQQQSSAPLSRQ